MEDADRKKLAKAGFATPRGGGKNAYQNHVSRSNRVILPLERLGDVDLDTYENGYVVRLFPEQCFSEKGDLRTDYSDASVDVEIGANAFVLYRTHAVFKALPPLPEWTPRGLTHNGVEVTARRAGAQDTGEYVVRLSNPTQSEGLPQGIFAPEYANRTNNELSQAVLAWLLCRAIDSPYQLPQAEPIKGFVDKADPSVLDMDRLERVGAVRDGVAICPLCTRRLAYEEFHNMLDLSDATALANAASQVEGATRSTIVNLFHLRSLLYSTELHHKPQHVAWGHAICNTVLGQRDCIPITEMRESGTALTALGDPFGYASADENMLRSDDGGVWIKLIERGHPDAPLLEELEPETVIDEDEA